MYCDITFADTYFSTRAFSTAWFGTEKGKYLETATNFIKDFCYFLDENGNAFTYDESSQTQTIPDWLKRATCEEALHLANLAKDPSQNDKKTTLGLASADGNVFNKEFAADILCPECVRILKNNGGFIVEGAIAGSEVTWGYFDK